jgi:IclR family acetate operon transcriptional repressor
VPVHSSALGKAICAALADDDIVDVLRAEGMARLTAKTITRVEDFLTEVGVVRAAGHALDDGEHEEDGRCVAVAIAGSGVPAAISVSAPAVRFSLTDVGPVADGLRDAANEIGFSRRDSA